MNEKLRNHVNILFAAAPSTDRAAEMKEELLANLNARYDDLLREGYDTTTAFHIALSGIGDLDELFQEFKKNGGEPVQAPVLPMNVDNTIKNSIGPICVGLAIALVIVAPGIPVLFEVLFHQPEIGAALMFVCWAAAAGLIAFTIIKSCMGSDGFMKYTPDHSFDSAVGLPVQIPAGEIANKRVLAGIFAIFFGALGLHKFYLGFVGAGLIMLLTTVGTLFILAPLTGTIGLIEGVIYLAKSNRDFYSDYVIQRRSWF